MDPRELAGVEPSRTRHCADNAPTAGLEDKKRLDVPLYSGRCGVAWAFVVVAWRVLGWQ